MHRVLAGLVAAIISLFGGLQLAFLLSPDPTGMTPFLLTPVIAAVPAVVFYREFRDE